MGDTWMEAFDQAMKDAGVQHNPNDEHYALLWCRWEYHGFKREMCPYPGHDLELRYLYRPARALLVSVRETVKSFYDAQKPFVLEQELREG